MAIRIHDGKRRYKLILIILAAACSVFLATSAQANAVTITDQARVLDVGKVKAEAGTLANPVLIFTTKTFGGDQEALNQATREQLTTQNAIAIEIDTVHRHMSVESGTQVKLSDDQASNAVSAFRDSFHGGDYTGATIAAIDAVRDELDGSSITPMGTIVAVLLVTGVIALICFMAFRRRRTPRDEEGRAHPYTHYYAGAPYTHGSSGGSSGGGGGFGGGAGGSF